MEGIFRRPSGVYYARLAVPIRLRQLIGKTELVATTGTRDAAIAKILGAELLAAWRRQLRAAQGLDPMDLLQVSVGSPMLAGGALLPLDLAARESGFEPDELIQHFAAGGLRIYLKPTMVLGFVVPFDSLDRDRETGGYDVPPPAHMPETAMPSGDPGLLRVLAIDSPIVAADLHKADECRLVLFEVAANRRLAFAPTGGLSVARATILLASNQVEALRRSVASRITPAQLADAQARRAAFTPPRTVNRRVSDAVDSYMADRSRNCSPDQARRIRSACELFVELTGNPSLVDVSRDFLRKYRDEILPRVPAHENKIRLQHGTATVTDSMKAVDGLDWPVISEQERVKRMQWLCGLFEWLAQERWIDENFSAGLAGAIRPREKRANHAKRDLFTPDDLRTIFSTLWFETGRGVLTKAGTYREFLPFYYWLPLLGLFTGARINELCQLALADIRRTPSGTWYIDINEDDEEEARRVKNAQSHRQIPVHPRLIQLGFIDWRNTLEQAEHRRLFPELRHDPTKGFSKAAVKWFSQFLARLGWARDGRKVFHSFRHTLASKCINELKLPEAVTAQISGHQRSISVLGSTYRKDIVPDELAPVLDQLSFALPDIAPFDCSEGLKALSDALRRKRSER